MDPFKGFDQLLQRRGPAAGRRRGASTSASPARRTASTRRPQRELKRLADELGLGGDKVGWADDLDEVYESARVVALASKPKGENGAPGEGAPLVLMEAMGAARPVVGTDMPGIAEVIEDCGSLVDPPDAENLAKALKPYLQDPQLGGANGSQGPRARRAADDAGPNGRRAVRTSTSRLAGKPAIP